jgi:hypothetical protein
MRRAVVGEGQLEFGEASGHGCGASHGVHEHNSNSAVTAITLTPGNDMEGCVCYVCTAGLMDPWRGLDRTSDSAYSCLD